MANTHPTLVNLFDDIADAIREKTGDTSSIIADTFPAAIRNIPKVNVQSSKTITSSMSRQTVKPDSGYDALAQVIVNGMSSGIGKSGSYTPTNLTTKQFTVTHNLGVIPNFGLCLIYPDDQTSSDKWGNKIDRHLLDNELFGFYKDMAFFYWRGSGSVNVHNIDVTQSWETQWANAGSAGYLALKWSGATTSTILLGGTGDDYCYEFEKGVTYHWVVGKI